MAGSGISGDFGGLKALIASLDSAKAKLLPKASQAMGAEVAKLYEGEFRQQRDPWGAQWPANKRGNPTGVLTGAMLGTPVSLSSGNIVRIRPPKYWRFFQAGAPARLDGGTTPRGILPYGPSKWDGPVEARIRATIETYFPA